MERLAKENGFLFKKMKPVMIGRQPVSSSRVRGLLAKGEVEKAEQCLCQPFSMFGKVIHGKGHGKHLGCPTANLEVHSEILLPLGVYIASACFLPKFKKGRMPSSRTAVSLPWIPGVMNFGKRPTYPKEETPRPVLELHLLDFKGQVYGEMMEIALHRFIRPEEKFSTEEALKVQIQKDIQAARRYYREK